MSAEMTDRTAPLRRASGAFAMVAVDQREAMRLMFAGDVAPSPDGSIPDAVLAAVPDEKLIDFKLRAARALSPFASAMLLDAQFAWGRAMAEGAIDESCAPILSADEFLPGSGEVVSRVRIDDSVVPGVVAAQGAKALKLLVIYREDEPAVDRVAMVRDFVARCDAAGLASIIEPVCKAPRHGGDWDWDAGVLAAAHELGRLGADLYKAEVPLRGTGDDDETREACTELDAAIASPWVVLSSGVSPDDFPRAVRLACESGASGFLAGRAVWRACIGAPDLDAALHDDAVVRLKRLVDVVDEVVGVRSSR